MREEWGLSVWGISEGQEKVWLRLKRTGSSVWSGVVRKPLGLWWWKSAVCWIKHIKCFLVSIRKQFFWTISSIFPFYNFGLLYFFHFPPCFCTYILPIPSPFKSFILKDHVKIFWFFFFFGEFFNLNLEMSYFACRSIIVSIYGRKK